MAGWYEVEKSAPHPQQCWDPDSVDGVEETWAPGFCPLILLINLSTGLFLVLQGSHTTFTVKNGEKWAYVCSH